MGSSGLGGGSATTAQPGVFSGRCTTEQGTPLANVDVTIGGVTTAGVNTTTETHSDSSGNYSQSLPPGQYSISSALYPVTLGSTNYLLPLATPDGASNDAADIGPGIARDLVLHIHGKISPSLEDTAFQSFYGGHIMFTYEGRYMGSGPPAGSITELTLVPTGPLADGTTGQTLTLHVTNDGAFASFLDIPIGQYTVSARLLNADGSVLEPLTIGPDHTMAALAPGQTSIESLTFPPAATGCGMFPLTLNDGSPGT